jgi:hypothetical protein
MSKKIKSQKITFHSLIRLVVFIVIIFFSIQWLSHQKKSNYNFNDQTTYINEEIKNNFLSNIYQKLPKDSRYQLEHFNETKVGIFFQDTFKYIQQQLNGFPNKQIKEIKKSVIKNISDDMIKNIDEN